MPYPFSVVIERIPLVNGYTSFNYAVSVWVVISNHLYGKFKWLGEIRPIKERLDRGEKMFFWSRGTSVTDEPDEGFYKIEVLDKEIVVELV